MIINFKYLFIIVISASFLSCEKKIITYKPETPKLQVISSIQGIDSAVQCYITKVNNLDDISLNYVNNAKVYLYDNLNNIIDTLVNIKEGYYKGKVLITKVNQNYLIKSFLDGYPNAEVIFQLPNKIDFEIESYTYENVYNNDKISLLYNLDGSKFNLLIKDLPEVNYFRLFVYRVDTNWIPKRYSNVNISSENLVVKAEKFTASINNEGFYFNDATFNGRDYFLDMKALVGGSPARPPFISEFKPEIELVFILQSISKDYYLYLKSLTNQTIAQGNGNIGLNYIYELYPYAPVYSNIEGGKGIFACYNYTAKKIIIKPS